MKSSIVACCTHIMDMPKDSEKSVSAAALNESSRITSYNVCYTKLLRIHECLTHTDWGMQLPATKLDLDSFKAAADTLFSESFGMSIMWVQQATIEDFINGVLNHIAATLSPNPLTGKLRLKLLRNDYDIDNLPESYNFV